MRARAGVKVTPQETAANADSSASASGSLTTAN